MHSILNWLGLPTPDAIYIIKSNDIFDTSGNIVNRLNFNSTLSNCSSNMIFIKPIKGRGGKGIIVGNVNEKGRYENEGITIDYDYLKVLDDDYIIESGLNQIKYLDEV